MTVAGMTKWDGGDVPVPDGTWVLVKRRNGNVDFGRAGDVFSALDKPYWRNDGNAFDIVAYDTGKIHISKEPEE